MKQSCMVLHSLLETSKIERALCNNLQYAILDGASFIFQLSKVKGVGHLNNSSTEVTVIPRIFRWKTFLTYDPLYHIPCSSMRNRKKSVWYRDFKTPMGDTTARIPRCCEVKQHMTGKHINAKCNDPFFFMWVCERAMKVCMYESTHHECGHPGHHGVEQRGRDGARLLGPQVRLRVRVVVAEKALHVHVERVRVLEVVGQHDRPRHDHQLKIEHGG